MALQLKTKPRVVARGMLHFILVDPSNANRRIDVIRVELVKNKVPFIVGPMMENGTIGESIENGKIRWRRVPDWAGRINKTQDFDLKMPSGILRPIWLSNGAFYPNYATGSRSGVYGSMVQNDRKFPSPRPGTPPLIFHNRVDLPAFFNTPKLLPKAKRWAVLCDINNEPTPWIGLHRQTKYESANDLTKVPVGGRSTWSWAMGGFGALVETITPGLVTEWHGLKPPNYQTFQRNWWWPKANGGISDNNGAFFESATYSAGPVIAMSINSNSESKALYLILQSPDRSFQTTTAYLKGGLSAGDFLEDIEHKSDGRIGWAYVADGGDSKSLWIRPSKLSGPLPVSEAGDQLPYGTIPEHGVSRKMPQMICLWGLVP